MKLIILKINPYREKDAIITAFNNEEIITFTARGILAANSKNAILNNPLIEADITFSEGKSKYLSVKSSNLIFSPYTLNDPLDKLAVISLIQECTSKILQEDELILIYEDLKNALYALKEGIVDPIQIAISFLSLLLKIAGSSFEINKCVFCESKKDLITFSFEDGGFVCRECFSGDLNKRFTPNQMLLLRSLFSKRNYKEINDLFNKRDGYIILEAIINYIDEGIGVRILSHSLLKS